MLIVLTATGIFGAHHAGKALGLIRLSVDEANRAVSEGKAIRCTGTIINFSFSATGTQYHAGGWTRADYTVVEGDSSVQYHNIDSPDGMSYIWHDNDSTGFIVRKGKQGAPDWMRGHARGTCSYWRKPNLGFFSPPAEVRFVPFED